MVMREEMDNRESQNGKRQSVVVTFTEYVSGLAQLNVLWLLSSLLILPLFAATEAVFYCVTLLIKQEPFPIWKTFKNYVKANLWSSIGRGAPFFILGLVMLVDAFVISVMPDTNTIRPFLMGALIVLSIVFLFLFFYHHVAVIDRKDTLKKRVLTALIYTGRYPLYSLGLVAVLLSQVLLSLYFVPLLFFFSLSFPAFCFTIVYQRVGERIKNLDQLN